MLYSSERRGPHCAIIYCKHKDTDSEQDVGTVSDKMGKRSATDSSEEDEWEYSYGADNNNTEAETCNNGSSSESRSATHTVESYHKDTKKVRSPQPSESETVRTTSKEDIQRLINRAEELVREEAVNSSPSRKLPSRLFGNTLRFNDKSKGNNTKVKEWLRFQEHDPDDKVSYFCLFVYLKF